MPRRSPIGSFAVPMSMPRYSCIASALTISAAPPRRRQRLGEVERQRRLAGAGRADDRPDAAGPRSRSHPDAQGRQAERDGLRPPRRRRPARARRRTRPACGPRRRRRACGGSAAARRRERRRAGGTARRGSRPPRRRRPGRGRSDPAGTSKCTSRLSSARPVRRWVAASFLPSPIETSTWSSRPTCFWFSSCEMRSCRAIEALVALLHDGLRHLVGHRRRGRALADRVLEREGAREAGLLDDAHRVFEVLVGLAGEARR